MKNSRLLVLIIIIVANQSFGQYSVSDFLSSPFQKNEVSGLLAQLEYMNSESFRSPIFRELEVRLRSNDFNASPEDFRLRLGILNPFEQHRNNKYNIVHKEYLETKYSFEANLIIANRYKQIIRYNYLIDYINQLNSDIEQLIIINNILLTGNYTLKDWIDADETLLDKKLKLKEALSTKSILKSSLITIHNIKDSINWETFEMISPGEVERVVFSDTIKIDGKYFVASRLHGLNEEAYKLEKAESFSNIGFIQAEYDTERGNELDEHLGFQLGITIPVFNSDKPKLQRQKLELIESESNLEDIREQTKLERISLNEKLIRLFQSYELINEKLISIVKLGNTVTYDRPRDYVELINYTSKLKMLKNEIYQDCLITYISLLSLTGELSKKPYVNYLSSGLELIE